MLHSSARCDERGVRAHVCELLEQGVASGKFAIIQRLVLNNRGLVLYNRGFGTTVSCVS